MASAIPLYLAPDGAGYRLMELPQELVDLIESDDAPTMIKLTPTPTAAVLKTPIRNYSLRQKNTSNGLILLRLVANTEPSTSDTVMTDDHSTTKEKKREKPKVSLHAFATLHETVELLPLEDGQEEPPVPKLGKWHEKLMRGR
ncbi:hypothetical protein V8F33_003788 [Rhypophila sp. PSN 637]